MPNISQTAGDRDVVSTERQYKVPYELPKKGGIFDLWWPWKVNFTSRNVRCGISRKLYEIKSSYQQNITIMSHTCYLKKLKYLTFIDIEKSRSLTEILDAEYLAIGTREFVSTRDLDKVAHWLLKKCDIFDLWWLWKIKVTNRNLRCGWSRKRYEIESLYQQNIIIKSHMGFLKK